MTQSSPVLKGVHLIWIKAILIAWMFLVVFIYLLLFGSPEFWLFINRLGLLNVLQAWRSLLEPFFTADYLS